MGRGMFEGYAAACDAPTCLFWRELSEFYPEAKVILTVRNPSGWYETRARLRAGPSGQ